MPTDESFDRLTEALVSLRKPVEDEVEEQRVGNAVAEAIRGDTTRLLRLKRFNNWLQVAVIAALVAAVLIITSNTNRAVKHEIPGLKAQAAEYRTQRDQLQGVLVNQAVPAITGMCEQIKSLGGECPTVVLDPEKEK